MSILSFPSAPVSGRTRPAAVAAVSALWAGAIQAWRNRQADRSMHLLSDEMLHDIGIARSEIETATRHGRPIQR